MKNIWSENTEIEIMWIHSMRKGALILMSFFTIYLTFLITLQVIYGLTINILDNDGLLGDAGHMNRQNQHLLRILLKIPFGSILFTEAKDCVICHESFSERVEIVQLKCNKNHIYHFHCIKNILESP